MRRFGRRLRPGRVLYFVLFFGFIMLVQYLMPVVLRSSPLFSILVVALLVGGIVSAFIAFQSGMKGGRR